MCVCITFWLFYCWVLCAPPLPSWRPRSRRPINPLLALAVRPLSRPNDFMMLNINEVGLRSNRTRANRGGGEAWVCRQPACTSAESKLVPVCQQEASKQLGAWKSANVLTDHIALEAGFSKQAYQAQCVTLDHAGREDKFVHVKKNPIGF